jgi:hypothetical protein
MGTNASFRARIRVAWIRVSDREEGAVEVGQERVNQV